MSLRKLIKDLENAESLMRQLIEKYKGASDGQ